MLYDIEIPIDLMRKVDHEEKLFVLVNFLDDTVIAQL